MAFDQPGGLSGPPLFDLSTELLSDIYQLTSGRIPLIGVGGISTAADAYAKIRAGASLVQIHTALIFAGMSLAGQINEGLIRLLSNDGFSNIADAIGADHRGERLGAPLPDARPNRRSSGYGYPTLAPLSAGNLVPH